MKMQKIKNFIIQMLGGYTSDDYWLIRRTHDKCKENFKECNAKLIFEMLNNQDIRDELNSLKPYQENYPTMVVPGTDVRDFVRDDTLKYEILDDVYTVPTMQQLKAFLRYDKVNKGTWTSNNYDCDNFAVDLWANAKRWDSRIALGFMTCTLHTYRHAINWALVYENDKVKRVFIEPQNDKIYEHFPNLEKVDRVLV